MKTRDLIDKLSQSADLLRSLAEAEEQRASKLSEAERDMLLAKTLSFLKEIPVPKHDDKAMRFFALRKELADALKRNAA